MRKRKLKDTPLKKGVLEPPPHSPLRFFIPLRCHCSDFPLQKLFWSGPDALLSGAFSGMFSYPHTFLAWPNEFQHLGEQMSKPLLSDLWRYAVLCTFIPRFAEVMLYTTSWFAL